MLITGDSGFIGNYLARKLVHEGHSLRGIDVVPDRFRLAPHPQVIGDITDPVAVRTAMTGADTVLHLAAEHKDSGISEAQYFRVNRYGTATLLDVAGKLDVMRFIFFSSVAVYGDQSGTTEETPPLPSNPYGASKLAAEEEVRRWAAEDPRRAAVIIRPTVIFGPLNRANIFRLVRQVCDGRFFWIGKGNHIKSVAYVENLVDASIFLLKRMKPGIDVFNYSDEPSMTVRGLVDLIAREAGTRVPGLHLPLSLAMVGAAGLAFTGKMLGREVSITPARLKKFNTPTHHTSEKIRSMGFTPEHSIADGVHRNVRWYLDEVKALSGSFGTSD
jgi:nucleoside-diphosphate-sugar epimerase